MKLEFVPFQLEHYPEYAGWFVDAELNRQLGPMDGAWLDAVLAEVPSAGATWAVFREAELVAVIETIFDPQNRSSAIITAVATKPELRRQGIGESVLQQLLSKHKAQGITEHIAFVSIDNLAGRRCVEKAGFAPTALEPDEHGYIEYRHHQ